jgi:glyoxylase-like metal-dependent hydrolase (beta-lactamase superfamily II)
MHYQIFERGWLSSNNILFFDDEGATLVDTGYCTHEQQTLALVESALIKQRQLRQQPSYTLTRIINTHLHSDHCGGNAALIAHYPQLQVHIPAQEAEKIRLWDEAQLSYQPTGQQCPRFMFTHVFEAGTPYTLGGETWQCHAAPGHDPHSVVLFNATSRTLISADALWENGCGVIFPELIGEPGFDDALATLDVIKLLEPKRVIPGHGSPFGDPAAAIQRAVERLEYLRADPKRNAAHGLRVLLKFHLIQTAVPIEEHAALAWLQSLSYFKTIRELHFPKHTSHELAVETVNRLIASGAATRSKLLLLNS